MEDNVNENALSANAISPRRYVKDEPITPRKKSASPRTTNRAQSLREYTERLLNKAKDYKMVVGDPLDIPPENIPFGLEPKWIRYYEGIGGRYDFKNVNASMDAGWEPAPIDLFPEFATARLGGVATEDGDEYVTRGDVVLCLRAKEIGDREREAYRQKVAHEYNNLSVDQGAIGHPVRGYKESGSKIGTKYTTQPDTAEF